MTEDDIAYLQNPNNAVVVPASADDPNIFGFVIGFPKGGDEQNVKLSIGSGPHRPDQTLDPQACQQYAAQIVDTLMRRGRMDLVDQTNWPSVAAAVQKLIMDFNEKRKPRGTLQ